MFQKERHRHQTQINNNCLNLGLKVQPGPEIETSEPEVKLDRKPMRNSRLRHAPYVKNHTVNTPSWKVM